MISYLVVLALLSTKVLQWGEASKCDPNIVSKIQKLWGTNIPSGLIQKADSAGKEMIVGTTADYYPSNTKCACTVWTGDQFTLTLVSTAGLSVSRTYSAIESKGIIIEPDSQVKRYHVYMDGGVTATYKCGDGSPVGIPEGAIKVKASYIKHFVEKAKRVLKGLGITITVVYPDEC